MPVSFRLELLDAPKRHISGVARHRLQPLAPLGRKRHISRVARHRLQPLAATLRPCSSMATTDEEVPRGAVTQKVHQTTIWEARCPDGEQCGKGVKLLYKKATRAEAAPTLAWHLLDTQKHAGRDWESARAEADNDEFITQSYRGELRWFDADDNMLDVEGKTQEKSHGGGKGKGKGGKANGGKGNGGSRRDRDRSRHRRGRTRSRSRSRSRRARIRSSTAIVRYEDDRVRIPAGHVCVCPK
jgi:hypothetical protein